MNESVKIFKYIVRFSICLELLLIALAIITTMIGIDSSTMTITISSTIGAIGFTTSKFIKDNKRIPNQFEKKKLVWYSFFASWLVPLLCIGPFFIYNYGFTYILTEVRNIELSTFMLILLLISIIYFFMIKFFYSVMINQFSKSIGKINSD